MFLAVPVEHKPSLKSPSEMTILLIVVNVLVYFGWQVSEETVVQRLAPHDSMTLWLAGQIRH